MEDWFWHNDTQLYIIDLATQSSRRTWSSWSFHRSKLSVFWSSVRFSTSTQASRSFCFIPPVILLQRSSAYSEKPVDQLGLEGESEVVSDGVEEPVVDVLAAVVVPDARRFLETISS